MLERPLLLTTRLAGEIVLRPLSPERDAAAFADHVVRGGEPLRAHLPWPDETRTPGGAHNWLAAYEQRRDGRVVAAGAWRGEELVGGGVLFHHDAEAAAVELGVWVVGDAAGAGVAAAVCRALIGEARRELGVQRVTWHCSEGNRASLRLAERLGFRHEGTLRGAYVLRGERRDLHVLGLTGDELDAGVRSPAPALLLYGDTERSSALRHEVPLVIGDPFLWIGREGRPALVVSSPLEHARLADALPDAELLPLAQLGFFDLVRDGMAEDEAELEIASRAARQAGVTAAVVPPEFPVAIADRLRREGVRLEVDAATFARRRRAKSARALAGIRRAQAAAEAGMAAAAELIWAAERAGSRLELDGEALTAERVRAAIRATCAAAGAPAPADIMVASVLSDGGHDPGSGPLPADLPITVDLWPRDEESGYWADMTRTFVGGAVSPEVARLAAIVRDALEAARDAVRPGVSGREVYDRAAGVVERAGFPTQRTIAPRETLTHGFYFGLGHGVGLDIHEPPALGLAGIEPLVAGDVIAIEPGIEGLPGIGGVRFEDLLLVTEDGCETLTAFPYDLTS